MWLVKQQNNSKKLYKTFCKVTKQNALFERTEIDNCDSTLSFMELGYFLYLKGINSIELAFLMLKMSFKWCWQDVEFLLHRRSKVITEP